MPVAVVRLGAHAAQEERCDFVRTLARSVAETPNQGTQQDQGRS